MDINGKSILVTGGTGSFGTRIVEKLLYEYDLSRIVVFSRDEKKQHDMRLSHKHPKLEFIIGDVRDRDSVFNATKHIDFVFHAAALKQVPNCEFFPYEAVKTNILGTQNVLDAAEANKVRKIVVLSTDKAVYPINAMGISKAMLEKLMLAKARTNSSETVYCGVRYGNVMYSRGSVIPLFVEQILKQKNLTITNPNMTRFLLPMPLAIDLVLFALEHGQKGDIFVRKSPAATIINIANALKDIFNSNNEIKNIGIRLGEKMHETLITQEDLMKAEEYDNYYRIKNLETLDFEKYFSEGRENHIPSEGYTSFNTQRLSLEETKKILLSLQEIQNILKGNLVDAT